MKNELFTIGHSNHKIFDFLRLLRIHGVDVLVDIRSHPISSSTLASCLSCSTPEGLGNWEKPGIVETSVANSAKTMVSSTTVRLFMRHLLTNIERLIAPLERAGGYRLVPLSMIWFKDSRMGSSDWGTAVSTVRIV